MLRVGKWLLAAAGLIGFADAAHAAMPLMGTIAGEKPIVLQSLQVKAEVSGGTAETTLHMVFYNPNRRALEGNLQFPLAANQQVTGFALDIGGKMRAAVPVEKSKGREVFEAIERRGVDPALLEATQGNNFKLRVFPVPAGGTRVVEVSYAESLARRGAELTYRLPLEGNDELDAFSLDVTVDGAGKAPRVDGSMRDFAFAKDRVQGAYSAHLSRSHFKPAGPLDIMLPVEDKPHSYVQEFQGNRYFLAEIPVSVARRERSLPHVVGLLWDSSGSGATRHVDAELAVLDAYFAKMGEGEVRLTRLRDRSEETRSFRVTGGDWRALRHELESTVYDGASALSDWKPEKSVGEYLLFSDGLQNYGSDVFPALAEGQRLYALDSAASGDPMRLSAWAEHGGGRLINIDGQAPALAARELLSEGLNLAGMRADGATALVAESGFPAGGLLRVAGKLTRRDAMLHLTLSQDGESSQLDLPLPQDAPGHPLAARNWASYRLHELEGERDTHRGEIRRLGEEFDIPSSETSLIVLETVQDYLLYDVTPPEEYRTEFERMRSWRLGIRDGGRQGQQEQLAAAFRERQQWWQRSFPKAVARPYVEKELSRDAPPAAMSVVTQPIVNSTTVEPRGETFGLSAPLRSSEPAVSGGNPGLSFRADAPAASSGASGFTAFAGNADFSAGLVARKSASDGKMAVEGKNAGIALKRWSANAPYITRMKAANAEQVYAIYLDEKPSYANSSAFFLDAADILIEKGRRDLGLRVLSNLAEMDLENRQVLRILGYRLMEANAPELAIPVLQKVLRLAEDEPQSFRDLGLAYAAAGHYQEAIDSLNEVAQRNWDPRFGDIALIAVGELNAIAATHSTAAQPLDLSRVDPRLIKNLPLDLRVVMGWDADNSDMDLWVTDPSGEKCFYGHNATAQGGRISRDVTQGYGPEEFILHHARPGKYKIEANFYGNRQQVVAGATTVQVKLTTGFGTAHAQDKMMTLRLHDRGDTVFIGEFEVK
jgi:hypothetical protein